MKSTCSCINILWLFSSTAWEKKRKRWSEKYISCRCRSSHDSRALWLFLQLSPVSLWFPRCWELTLKTLACFPSPSFCHWCLNLHLALQLIMANKTFCVSLRLPELFCYSHQIYPGAPARSEPKKFNYAGSQAGSAEASHLIFAQCRIQHPPHPHRCLSSVSFFADEYALFNTNSPRLFLRIEARWR